MARILVVGARGIPDVEGGAEKNAEQLFPRLVDIGHEVTLLSLASNVKENSYRGVKLVAVPSLWLLKTDKILYYFAAIYHAIRLRPQIVHLQGLGAALFLWVYKLMGIRTVVRYGSADYILPKWGVLGRLGFRLSEYQLQFADAVISVSETLSQRLAANNFKARVHFIPNAIDEPHPLWSGNVESSEPPYILAVGRVTSQKNVDTLLRAFALFRETSPHYVLRVAGSLSDETYVEALSAFMSDGVTMLGAIPRNQVPALLSHCALYVNLSHHEGNSNATLEAISHGCPILVSDIPENHEMPLGPANFVDQDDVAAVANAFSAAMTKPEAFVVSRAGFLSWDKVAASTNNVYRTIL
ncbi:glycosyltransferase family 4 protein [Devosia beringensis]|uniref:glycosyltransferase family 4 protein n=1 Tax=Devosia beringensis TaxID=2657486 RepID=UPI00186B87DD|nr:glycosyltransferase family 4 protein [Devosia beringensis]